MRLANQMVFQNPLGSLNPPRTVGAILTNPLTINRRGVEGELPSPLDPPPGFAFASHATHATSVDSAKRPALRPVDGRLVACHHAEAP